jgi:hypothetical protein
VDACPEQSAWRLGNLHDARDDRRACRRPADEIAPEGRRLQMGIHDGDRVFARILRDQAITASKQPDRGRLDEQRWGLNSITAVTPAFIFVHSSWQFAAPSPVETWQTFRTPPCVKVAMMQPVKF